MAPQTNDLAADGLARPLLGRGKSSVALGAALLLLSVALSACAGDAAEGASPAATVSMGEYFFAPAELTVRHGANVLLKNEGAMAHSWVVQGAGVGSAGIPPGRSFVLTLKDVPPGRYTVYCDQPGHAQAGQRGVLVIA